MTQIANNPITHETIAQEILFTHPTPAVDEPAAEFMPIDLPGGQNPTEEKPPLITDIESAGAHAESLTRRALERTFNRRTFIKTGLLLGGAAVADTTLAYRAEQSMHKKLPDTPAHFNWVTGYNPDVHREVMLYFPGTGDIHSVEEAQTFRRLSGIRDLPIGALVMSHYHTTQDELIEKTVEALKEGQPDYVSFVGRSWGGPEGLVVTAAVADILGCTLKRFSMWSAPYDISDGYQGSLGRTLDDWFPDWNVFNFDGKVIAVLGRQIRENGFWHTLANLDDVKKEIMSGEDWNGLRSDVHMLNELSNHQTIKHIVPKVSQPGITNGTYISSFRPWTDPTVKVIPAFQKYAEAFAGVGIPFRNIRGDFEGHAKVTPCIEAMIPWLKATNHVTLATR